MPIEFRHPISLNLLDWQLPFDFETKRRAMTALRQLLTNIVDYAGLFPPAGLPLPQVINNYARYLDNENRWMLSRVIIPAMKLPEFVDQYNQLSQSWETDTAQTPWKISALIPAINAPDGGFTAAIETISQFNQNCSFAQVDTVEGKLPTPDLAASTCEQIPDQLAAFLEIPFADPEPGIQAIRHAQRSNAFGKIRTGGMTPDLIPSAECVARFIETSANHNLGFKATAGLHHPLRGEFGLTYEPDTDRDVMHGFINVFLAACLARVKQWTAPQLIAVWKIRTPRPSRFPMRPSRLTKPRLLRLKSPQYAANLRSPSVLVHLSSRLKTWQN